MRVHIAYNTHTYATCTHTHHIHTTNEVILLCILYYIFFIISLKHPNLVEEVEIREAKNYIIKLLSEKINGWQKGSVLLVPPLLSGAEDPAQGLHLPKSLYQ